MRWLKQPLNLTMVFLLLLYGVATYVKGAGMWEGEMGRVLGVGMGFLGVQLLVSLLWHIKSAWQNLVITMLLLLLLAHYESGFWGMLGLGLITGVIKSVFRLDGQPIFNPAAAGLLASSAVGVLTSWWGVSFAPRLPIMNMSVAMLLTIPFGVYLGLLYKKIPTMVGIPVVFLLTYYLLTGRVALTTVFEGTFMFFLLVMATEPKTTPLIDWQEMIYAVLLGSLLAFLFVYRIAGEPYLGALVLVNFLFSVFKWVQIKVVMRRAT